MLGAASLCSSAVGRFAAWGAAAFPPFAVRVLAVELVLPAVQLAPLVAQVVLAAVAAAPPQEQLAAPRLTAMDIDIVDA